MKLILLALLVALAITAGSASATTSKAYTCTLTSHGTSPYAYGVIFGSTNKTDLVVACQSFAQSSHFRLQFGLHTPLGWVMVAQYVNTRFAMVAVLISPPAVSNTVFRLTNRLVFHSHGWTLTRRGG